MAKRNNSGGFSFLSWVIHVIIGFIIVATMITIGATKFGIQFPTMLKGITEGRVDYFLDGLRGINQTNGNSSTPNTSVNINTEGWGEVKSGNQAQKLERYKPLSFTGKKQLVLGDFDSLGRATFSHIQLKNSDEPLSGTREPRITFDPIGWHNYQMKYKDGTGELKKAWLMNRGHLVGYQFSGLNDEGRNLVPMTRYLNAGSISDNIMDDNNYNAMLFYENALDDWLEEHPTYTLDYCVMPNYTDKELIPRSVTLYWSGYDDKGALIRVTLKNMGLESYSGNVAKVTLNNVSENAKLDYATGMATPLYK